MTASRIDTSCPHPATAPREADYARTRCPTGADIEGAGELPASNCAAAAAVSAAVLLLLSCPASNYTPSIGNSLLYLLLLRWYGMPLSTV
jgi:hypothetical protein